MIVLANKHKINRVYISKTTEDTGISGEIELKSENGFGEKRVPVDFVFVPGYLSIMIPILDDVDDGEYSYTLYSSKLNRVLDKGLCRIGRIKTKSKSYNDDGLTKEFNFK